MTKNHDPKNPPPGYNLGPKFSASVWSLVRKKNNDLAVQYEDFPWVSKPNDARMSASDKQKLYKAFYIDIATICTLLP